LRLPEVFGPNSALGAAGLDHGTKVHAYEDRMDDTNGGCARIEATTFSRGRCKHHIARASEAAVDSVWPALSSNTGS
jgi:hypothetical protein